MRGPGYHLSQRMVKPQPVSVATTTTTYLPAPVGGWNARDSLAAMNPLDAVMMDNFYPGTSSVDLRPGNANWATGMGDVGKSFIQWNGPSSSKLFCGTDAGIYNVTASGAVGAAATACTSGWWIAVNMSTAGGAYTVSCNGVDKMKLYNGTTWINLDSASTPAITGVATTDIANITIFKRRIWMLENHSMTAHYLGIDSIAGAATAFPMGPIFPRGGYLVAQANWTIDGGTGLDDYLVTVTSKGEVGVYQGTDPDSADTWSLVGTYYVGEPIGKKCFLKFGGDLLYLSKQGAFLLSKLLLSATIDRSQSAVSYKIDGAINEATATWGKNLGWEATLYPDVNALILNIPVAEETYSYQFVMNNITKAWCRFTNWNATAFTVWEEKLYFAEGTTVKSGWTGTSDNGIAIQGSLQQAYTNFQSPIQTSVSMIRPNYSVDIAATLNLGIDTDYQAYNAMSTISYGGAASTAVWDISLWDGAVWSAGVTPVEAKWRAVPSKPGYTHSLRLQITTSLATFSLVSTNFAIQTAGIL